jgi:hypothetical protein
MAVQATRRIVLLLATALVVVAMMTAPATSAFAAPKGGQTPENSCGASNPNIGDFPPNRENKEESGQFEDCGFRNNPNFVPPDNQG